MDYWASIRTLECLEGVELLGICLRILLEADNNYEGMTVWIPGGLPFLTAASMSTDINKVFAHCFSRFDLIQYVYRLNESISSRSGVDQLLNPQGNLLN
jgi:hypothetical protein